MSLPPEIQQALHRGLVIPACPLALSAGRNVPSGFGMEQVDFSLKKEFHFGEQRGIQLRLEAFNVLNQANFADPIKFMDSPLFGQSTSMLNTMLGTGSSGSGLAPVLQIGGPRSVQLSVRLHF